MVVAAPPCHYLSIPFGQNDGLDALPHLPRLYFIIPFAQTLLTLHLPPLSPYRPNGPYYIIPFGQSDSANLVSPPL